MRICGLQKTTLLDYPGKVACTVFLGGCNFRCPFCQNSEILSAASPAAYTEEELFAFLQKRRGILEGVCVSGGEPLLHEEAEGLLKKIKVFGYCVKVDTNGSFPARLKKLCKAGLVDFVAMDIKNSPAKYAQTCGATVELAAERDALLQLLDEWGSAANVSGFSAEVSGRAAVRQRAVFAHHARDHPHRTFAHRRQRGTGRGTHPRPAQRL